EDAHIHNIRGGGNNRSNCEYDEDGVAQISPEPSRRHDSHQGQEKDKDREFEDDSQTHDQDHKEISVLSDRDHRLELLSVTDQKGERGGIDHLEAEETAAQKESDRRKHEWDYILLFIAVQSG